MQKPDQLIVAQHRAQQKFLKKHQQNVKIFEEYRVFSTQKRLEQIEYDVPEISDEELYLAIKQSRKTTRHAIKTQARHQELKEASASKFTSETKYPAIIDGNNYDDEDPLFNLSQCSDFTFNQEKSVSLGQNSDFTFKIEKSVKLSQCPDYTSNRDKNVHLSQCPNFTFNGEKSVTEKIEDSDGKNSKKKPISCNKQESYSDVKRGLKEIKTEKSASPNQGPRRIKEISSNTFY